jgi:hypothetical protein
VPPVAEQHRTIAEVARRLSVAQDADDAPGSALLEWMWRQ